MNIGFSVPRERNQQRKEGTLACMRKGISATIGDEEIGREDNTQSNGNSPRAPFISIFDSDELKFNAIKFQLGTS